ncbi:hypothetical protein BP00DRAFT_424761 [Aspergillus indologenus CBS 114.80]|uniref:Uncharacterized protein n=1 Tax=Aspergillus indologenus CBS 114.80 TaxID=1450541 RepID=A0A2V5I7B2_9EURO|nr:hypothetical protein BP00DRAFT_424761 [Aspergillus indologenus CBS 114.80]
MSRYGPSGSFDPDRWGIERVDPARKILQDTLKEHWTVFLQEVARKTPMDRIIPITANLGAFMTIWYNQQMVQQLPAANIDIENNVVFTPRVARVRAPRPNRAAAASRTGHGSIANPLDPGTPCPVNSDSALAADLSLFSLDPELRTSSRTPLLDDTDDTDADDDLETPPSQRKDGDYKPGTPTNPFEDPDSFPGKSDENIVNTLMISFANIVTFCVPEVKGHWTQERKGFKVVNEAKSKLYEARTDGHFSLYGAEHSKVIIEVKPMDRSNCPRVRMQETAQMAAWIHAERDIETTSPAKRQRFRRLLISQNRLQIFLIVAEYDAEYVDYVTNPKRKEECKSFLRMHEFGPWDIVNSKEVGDIAAIILAVTLQFSKGRDLHPTT